ncbi:hypothetical protein [Streptomyces similanensis]|uniref:Uncharacterized protein n=1 Tax=Streptomyces similanensis TaxID=1274988 RepID=A0ABP9L7M2_9ACTN
MQNTDMPYEVRIGGAGFSQVARFATVEEAYAEAHRVRKTAETGERVAFTNLIGRTGMFLVLGIRINGWNPSTNTWLSHAGPWTAKKTPADALTPIPADWHGVPLPDDWYGQTTAA